MCRKSIDESSDSDVNICSDCFELVKDGGVKEWDKLTQDGKKTRMRVRKKQFKVVYDPTKDPIKTGIE
jgi:hypothetical protein